MVQSKVLKPQFLKSIKQHKKNFGVSASMESKARARQNSVSSSFSKVTSQELKSLDIPSLQKDSESLFNELRCDPSYGKVCYGSEKFLILRANSLTKQLSSFLARLDAPPNVLIGKERVIFNKNKKT